MLKKTTIYLEEQDIKKLKALAVLLGSSMTDMIRQGVDRLIESLPSEQKSLLKTMEKMQVAPKKKKSNRG